MDLLVENLEIERIETPVEQRAEAMLVEMFGVLKTTLRRTIIGANSSRPASLAVPDLGHIAAGLLFDVRNGLVHIVEVYVRLPDELVIG